MKKLKYLIIIILMMFISVHAKEAVVIDISGEINEATLMNTKRALKSGSENKKNVVFKISSKGGSTKAAFDIANLILNSNSNTIAYCEEPTEAESTIIALSCDKIYLNQSAAIGNINKNLKDNSKNLNEFLSRVEKKKGISKDSLDMLKKPVGKNTSKNVPEILISSNHALDYGVSDGTVKDLKNVLELENISSTEDYREPQEIRLLNLISNRYVSTAILTIALVAMIIEVFSPGFGFFGTLSILLFIVFFVGNIIITESSVYVALLFMVGIALILIEAVIPGFGICGIMGIILSVAGVILAMGSFERGLVPTASAMIVGIFATNIMIKRGMKSEFLQKISLNDSLTSTKGYLSVDRPDVSVGDVGYTLTPLKPTGFIFIEGAKLEAISEDGMIEHGEKIVVSKVDGSKVIVRR
ncbi:nodulation efficiency protein D [Peptoniphilus duerdenii ATCC BAA-1640]|uniref:Nodulation efficiency protein D n=1 Tax=Peptoniphilus duerdenii ATCC BAA-1640 TaxID=862517 RepID=E0NKU7_9FIRM|nr:NfeD family protein [Peptoniphilus duerdenii]EFM25573.1 nodulation efficiency protein D [Peptoniphilus duerdenii ATCC BAA-1640]